MVTALDLEAISAEFLNECGICNHGIGSSCRCSKQDFRPTMLALIRELEQVRADRDEVSSVLDALIPKAQSSHRQVEAARAFAAEMAGYCSPPGVSAEYAQRLLCRMEFAG